MLKAKWRWNVIFTNENTAFVGERLLFTENSAFRAELHFSCQVSNQLALFADASFVTFLIEFAATHESFVACYQYHSFAILRFFIGQYYMYF